MYQYLTKLIHYRDFINASDKSIYLMSKRFKSDIISDTALLLYIISTECETTENMNICRT